jgi:uncharacterized protein
MMKKYSFIIIIMCLSFLNNLFAQDYVSISNDAFIKAKKIVKPKAFFYSPNEVTLQDDFFALAQERNLKYLLSLHPDRFLHRFMRNAGLQPKDSIYGGWESKQVSGFNLGHYLSACAIMYANTNNKVLKANINYTVKSLAALQKIRTTGYVGGIPNEDTLWQKLKDGIVETQGADLNGVWVPWYVVHKLMAGLADVYVYTNNHEALHVLIGLGNWTYETTKNLSDAQVQKMLDVEFGGMGDILVHLYELTADKKYLKAAAKFYHKKIMQPLAKKTNQLNHLHANTQFPKVLAQYRLYSYNAAVENKNIGTFFWDEIVNKHSYVIGGNSDNEHFGLPNKLNEALTIKTTETCNSYNMLKLTKMLFANNPTANYFDFYERTLYNHIMASYNIETGNYCYYAPLKSNSIKIWSKPYDDFWCCVGTGMESHSKHATQIFATNGANDVYVNLYISAALKAKRSGIGILQKSSLLKNGNVQVTILSNKSFTLHLRNPKWANNDVKIKLNGNIIAPAQRYGYFIINKKWQRGDMIELFFPLKFHAESMPDNENRIALMYGPVVLAGVVENNEIPNIVSDEKNIESWIEVANNRFYLRATDKTQKTALIPFYAVTDEHQMVYFDYYSKASYELYKESIALTIKKEQGLNAATLDIINPGEQQSEIDHNFIGEHSKTGNAHGKKWRDAKNGWFAYSLPIIKNYPKQAIQLLLWGNDKDRVFDVLINDELVKTINLKGDEGNRFYTVDIALEAEMIRSSNFFTVKFQAKENSVAGGIYGIRLIRK